MIVLSILSIKHYLINIVNGNIDVNRIDGDFKKRGLNINFPKLLIDDY